MITINTESGGRIERFELEDNKWIEKEYDNKGQQRKIIMYSIN